MTIIDFSSRETILFMVCAICGGQVEMRSDGSMMAPKHERTQIMATWIDGMPIIAFFCSPKCRDQAKCVRMEREGEADALCNRVLDGN